MYANKIRDLQDPADNFFIRQLLLAIGKKPRSRDQHLLVSAVLLEKLVSFNSLIILGTVLYPTIFVMLYHGAMHISSGESFPDWS